MGKEAEYELILDLFLTFLKIGLFSIGGGYATLPLIQQQAVVAVGVYVVDVGVAQCGVLGDGLRQRLEAARAGVEDAEGVVAGYPQLVVVQVRVVGIAVEGDRLFS